MQMQMQMPLMSQQYFASQLHGWVKDNADATPPTAFVPAAFTPVSPMNGKRRSPGTTATANPKLNPNPSKKSKTNAIVYKGTVLLMEDDGWEWSKYGQKEIRQSTFSVRHYYRCKSKTCAARKHVQQTLSHPIQTTTSYSGEHTCCLEVVPAKTVPEKKLPEKNRSEKKVLEAEVSEAEAPVEEAPVEEAPVVEKTTSAFADATVAVNTSSSNSSEGLPSTVSSIELLS